MYFEQKPENFNPKMEIVSCFIEYENTFLLIRRAANKPQPNTWGIPAGKKELHETKKGAVIREVKEETTITIEQPTYYTTVYIRYTDYDFLYHMFTYKCKEKPHVILNPNEHTEYTWVTPQEALTYNLIEDEESCIEKMYTNKKKEKEIPK